MRLIPQHRRSGVTENLKAALPRILTGQRRRWLAGLVANGFLQAATTIGISFVVRAVFDRLTPVPHHHEASFVWGWHWLCGALLTLAVLHAWSRWFEKITAERLGQSYTHELRLTLFAHLLRMPPHVLQQRSQGATALRFIGDLTALRQWISLGLARLIVAGTAAICVLVALVLLSPWLALATGLTLMLGALGAIPGGKALRNAASETRRRRSQLAANVNEKIAALAVVQVFNQTQHERQRVARQSRKLKKALITRANITGWLRALAEGSALLANIAVLMVGAYEVTVQRLTPGAVAAALTIIHYLSPPLRELGWVLEYWHNSRVALTKIEEFLQLPVLRNNSRHAPRLKAEGRRLAFTGVSVRGALHSFTAVAQSCTVIAIAGPNGAGKSTLLALAAGLRTPDAGVVTLDGQDLATHRASSLRRLIGVVGPDFPLLRGTVADNLRYRLPASTSAELDEISELCGLPELFSELPAGTATRLVEGGKNLSAGQRQRLALARALLGRPHVLLLDEVDANLDAQASACLDRVLASYEGTVLLVTHRPERIARADAIWYLENGRLVEAGTTDEIFRLNGAAVQFLSNQYAAMVVANERY